MVINCPPSRAGKDVKCPGYARGVLKLRFDRYIKPGMTHITSNRRLVLLLLFLGLFCCLHKRKIVNNYWTRLSQNIVICRSVASRMLRQIIDLRDTDKLRYFAITEFNNFITRSSSLFSYFNHSVAAQGGDLPFFSRVQQTRSAGTTH